ncbi:MAG: hypothetical protein ACYDC3_02215 [Candidatus Binataceae bacterium]
MIRRILLVLCLCSLSACGIVEHDAADVRADNTDMNAASKKIIIAAGADVPGYSKITTLGTVEGYCEKNPQGDDQTIPGDSMRLAAYRKYGTRVGAITGSHGWFVPKGGETSAEHDPGTSAGYWECSGTAVSLTSAPAPPR